VVAATGRWRPGLNHDMYNLRVKRRDAILDRLGNETRKRWLDMGQAAKAVSRQSKIAGHVFISYVRGDSYRVDQLQRTLRAAGFPVWRDTAELWPGEDWRAKIRRAITDNALVFIACFSHASLARGKSYQNEELTLAIEQLRLRRPDDPWLIPVRFDECVIPDWEIGGGRTLTSIQRVDLFGDRFNDNAARLVAAIWRILAVDSDADGSEEDREPDAGGWAERKGTITGQLAPNRSKGSGHQENTVSRDAWVGIFVSIFLAVAAAGSAPWWWKYVHPPVAHVAGSANPSAVVGMSGGGPAYQVFAQNRWAPLGAATREQPNVLSTQVGSYPGNMSIAVNGWVYGRAAYPTNTSPWNSNIWFHLADGAGWLSFAGVRATPTSPDPTGLANGGDPAPTPAACEGAVE
jgi:hypothetical protein